MKTINIEVQKEKMEIKDPLKDNVFVEEFVEVMKNLYQSNLVLFHKEVSSLLSKHLISPDDSLCDIDDVLCFLMDHNLVKDFQENIIKLLNSTDSLVVIAAIECCIEGKFKNVRKNLLKLLNFPDEVVRKWAIIALDELSGTEVSSILLEHRKTEGSDLVLLEIDIILYKRKVINFDQILTYLNEEITIRNLSSMNNSLIPVLFQVHKEVLTNNLSELLLCFKNNAPMVDGINLLIDNTSCLGS